MYKNINIDGVDFKLKKPIENFISIILNRQNGITKSSDVYESYLKYVVKEPKLNSIEDFENKYGKNLDFFYKLMKECETIIEL